MTVTIYPSTFQEILMFARDYVFRDLQTFAIVIFVLLLIAWAAMGYFLGLDDKAWQIFTFAFGVFFFMGMIYLFDEVLALIDFQSLIKSILP